eukprot:TRINITY_DN8579_c0_g1_i12.p1 TRINITY_DN8579_c0_g1~~TRINITY_DN8579_c0_g1_i12.p1  ORF type:complete len:393 (-),score=80.17 TRINITY_DN8579_c0_g1_i12:577-1755(-)
MSYSNNPNFQPKKLTITVVDNSLRRQVDFEMFGWSTIAVLKNKIAREFGVEPKFQRLFYCNYELRQNNNPLFSYGNVDTNWTVYLHLNTPTGIFVRQLDAFEADANLQEVLEQVREGFRRRYRPILTSDGTSGTYFLKDRNKKNLAIFKPIDEEPYTPNNPKGFVGPFGSQSLKRGILSGEGGAREVAAFLLDSNGFHGVPPTTFVELWHPCFAQGSNPLYMTEEDGDDVSELLTPKREVEDVFKDSNKALLHYVRENRENVKLGSLQAFVKHDDVASNFGYSVFDVEEVHRIGVLDIRILNCDRNDENVLVRVKMDPATRSKKYRLIPIDHALSLPDTIDISEYDIVWMGWPQAKSPFSEQTLAAIRAIDPIQDAKKLTQHIGLREVKPLL